MTAVVVTGGAGYIGSVVCKRLFEAGILPIVLDNLSTGHADFVKWGPLVVANVSDRDAIESIVREYRPHAAIHFAASAYVGESVLNPLKYFQNNVAESIALIQNLVDFGVHEIVFSSSCATYGQPIEPLIDESIEQHPINPYGLSKLMVEQILDSVSNALDFRHVTLRYFNAAGAEPNSGVGELHQDETHLIPRAIHSSIAGETFQVFGNDYETPDGTAVRDYIHVSDLADAHVRAFEYLRNGGPSIKLNLGTGIGTSVQQILNAIQEAGYSVRSEYAARRPGDPDSLVANARLAESVLGWLPKHSSVNEIVQSALSWHLAVDKRAADYAARK